MQKEVITDKQAVSILILFLFGSTMLIRTGTEAKRDMWIAKSGIEVLGRCSEFFLLLLYFVIIVIALLIMPKMRLGSLLPIMQNGPMPIAKGTFAAEIKTRRAKSKQKTAG